jgi:hypothetical protein
MATYWVKSGTGGADTGASWATAAESIAGLMAAQALAANDIIYVHNTHNAQIGAATTWTLPESGANGIIYVLCVDGGDATGASLVDGTVGNLATGAAESTNADATFTIATTTSADLALFVHGITIKAGSGGAQNSADINLQQTAGGLVKFHACRFEVNSSSATALLSLGCTGTATQVYEKCVFKFGSIGQYLNNAGGCVRMIDCAIDSTGSAPTTIFGGIGAARQMDMEVTGCDFSVTTNCVSLTSMQHVGRMVFNQCALGTNAVTGTYQFYTTAEIEFQACSAVDGTNGANILQYYRVNPAGVVQSTQTIYKATGGAQGEQDDGTDTSYSLELIPSTRCTKFLPLYTPWIYKLVPTTGDKTVTMIVGHTESAVLTGSEVWLEVQYMGEPGATGTQRIANSPHAVVEVDDGCPVISGTVYRDVIASGSNRTDDGIDDWTGLSSEKEHTLTASINCAEVGYIRCRVGLGKDTTNNVYVDPKVGVA